VLNFASHIQHAPRRTRGKAPAPRGRPNGQNRAGGGANLGCGV